MESGTYTGDSADNRAIVGTFPPALAVTKAATSVAGAVLRTQDFPADSAVIFGAASPQANYIQKFGANGFEVGSDNAVNAAAVTFYWFMFSVVPLPILRQRIEGY